MSEAKGAAASAAAPALTDLAERIRSEIAAAEEGHRSALAHAIRAGELLTEAKGQMGHGEWLPWLEQNFPGVPQTAQRYMALAANAARVRHLGSVREALAAIKPPPSEPNPKRKGRDGRYSMAKDPAIITWVAERRAAGMFRDEIVAASKAGEHGWPGPSKGMSSTPADQIFTALDIVAARDEQPKPSKPGKPPPKQSGKRLRELHTERKHNPNALLDLQIKVMKAVGAVEGIEIPEVGLSEAESDAIAALYDDLGILLRWADTALVHVSKHVNDLDRQRKINLLKVRVSDQSSTPGERDNAARLLEILERKHHAARIEAGL